MQEAPFVIIKKCFTYTAKHPSRGCTLRCNMLHLCEIKSKCEFYIAPLTTCGVDVAVMKLAVSSHIFAPSSYYSVTQFAQPLTPFPSFNSSSITLCYLLLSLDSLPKGPEHDGMNISLNCILSLSIIKCHILINILKIQPDSASSVLN